MFPCQAASTNWARASRARTVVRAIELCIRLCAESKKPRRREAVRGRLKCVVRMYHDRIYVANIATNAICVAKAPLDATT